jgi:acyl-CoA thioester hydrolase
MQTNSYKLLKYIDYPHRTYDKVRYRDTDRQEHVNNSVFSTFFETGRVEFMVNPEKPIACNDCSFVIASIKMDFLQEINWPGIIEIGTGITKMGNSSITLIQGLYQNNLLVGYAESVIVQVSNITKKSHPLSEHAKEILSSYLLQIA